MIVAYGEFTQAYGKIDFTERVVEYALKGVPAEARGGLADRVRELVAGGWTAFDFNLPDGIPDPPWRGVLRLDRVFEGTDLPPEVREGVARRLYEASVWLLQRALMVLVLRHGEQWGGHWDGAADTLDFDFIDGARLEVEMPLVEGMNICDVRHAVEGGKLTLLVRSTLLH